MAELWTPTTPGEQNLVIIGEPVACQSCGRRWLHVETGGYVAELPGSAAPCCVSLLIHLTGAKG